VINRLVLPQQHQTVDHEANAGCFELPQSDFLSSAVVAVTLGGILVMID